MKTVLDQDIEIFEILNASTALKSAITGGIYKGSRPINSSKEDVVVNTITLREGSIQAGVSNVNIHVSDLSVTIAGVDQNVANYARIITITNLVKPLLEDAYGDDFNLWIESTTLFPEPTIKQHYMNLRIQFRFANH